jgi:hypothetical protein
VASVGWMSDGRTRPDRSMHHDPMKAKHNSRIMNAWRFHKPRGYRRAAARKQARSHDERASGFWHLSDVGLLAEVPVGSWLCENAKTLNHDRRSCSSKTVLVAQRASGFNLEVELKNIILRRVSIFEFLHSQGHSRRFGRTTATSGLPR